MVNKDEASGYGFGMLLGVILGAAIGILYAPRPGAETRAMIRERVETAEDRAEEIISEARQKAKRMVERARRKTESED